MELTAISVADYVRKSLELPKYDRFKLLKLVYFAQAWHLAWTGKPIFDEPFEAWPNGPVEPNVYRVARYGQLTGADQITGETAAIIDAILDYYGRHDYKQLVELSHEDEPWVEARRGLEEDEPSNRQLSAETLRDYYVHRAVDAPNLGPQRPALPSEAADAGVQDALHRTLARWSGALAILADR